VLGLRWLAQERMLEISSSAGSSFYERIEARLQFGDTVNPTRPLSTDMNYL